MLFVRAFDPILILGAIVRQLFGDFVWPARRIGESIRSELHDLSYREFVHFGSPLSLPPPGVSSRRRLIRPLGLFPLRRS